MFSQFTDIKRKVRTLAPLTPWFMTPSFPAATIIVIVMDSLSRLWPQKRVKVGSMGLLAVCSVFRSETWLVKYIWVIQGSPGWKVNQLRNIPFSLFFSKVLTHIKLKKLAKLRIARPDPGKASIPEELLPLVTLVPSLFCLLGDPTYLKECQLGGVLDILVYPFLAVI